MRSLAAAVALAGLLVPATARADYDLCGRDVVHHGTPLDLDVKDADVHAVFRLLADTARLNIVLPDDLTGRVTLRVKQVPWQQLACSVAASQRLVITVSGNILLVTKRP